MRVETYYSVMILLKVAVRYNWSFTNTCRFHHLKLYPEDESGPQSTKKPVVVESYNEIVFPDPSEALLARVQNHPSLVLPRLPAGFTLPSPGNFSDSVQFL